MRVVWTLILLASVAVGTSLLSGSAITENLTIESFPLGLSEDELAGKIGFPSLIDRGSSAYISDQCVCEYQHNNMTKFRFSGGRVVSIVGRELEVNGKTILKVGDSSNSVFSVLEGVSPDGRGYLRKRIGGFLISVKLNLDKRVVESLELRQMDE